MLDLPQALPMFASQAIDAVDDVDAKFNATHLYYQTQHAVQIIQLVECAPPPPRRILSPEQSSYSSCLSSSYCSEEEEEESECSSYCSSIEPVLEQSCPPQPATSESADTDTDTYGLRMKRILAWREDFSSHLSSTLSDTSISTSSLKKRKMSISAEDIDSISHSSKRSRSHSSCSQDEGRSSCGSLGALSCPACDASFDTRQDLRHHARAGANEACIAAVDYAFE